MRPGAVGHPLFDRSLHVRVAPGRSFTTPLYSARDPADEMLAPPQRILATRRKLAGAEPSQGTDTKQEDRSRVAEADELVGPSDGQRTRVIASIQQECCAVPEISGVAAEGVDQCMVTIDCHAVIAPLGNVWTHR